MPRILANVRLLERIAFISAFPFGILSHASLTDPAQASLISTVKGFIWTRCASDRPHMLSDIPFVNRTPRPWAMAFDGYIVNPYLACVQVA